MLDNRAATTRNPFDRTARAAIGTGTTVSSIEAVRTRAREGRIDTLLVTDGASVWGYVATDTGTVVTSPHPSIDSEDLIDRAVFDTLAKGGDVVVTDAETLGSDRGVAAILRY